MRRIGFSPRRKTAPSGKELVGMSVLLFVAAGGVLVTHLR